MKTKTIAPRRSLRISIALALLSSLLSFQASTANAVVADPGESSIDISPRSIPADGVSGTTIDFFLNDSSGNLIFQNEDEVTFELTGVGALGAVSYAGSGVYTANYTPGTSAGTVTITVKVNGSYFLQDTITLTQTSGELELIREARRASDYWNFLTQPQIRIKDANGATMTSYSNEVIARITDSGGNRLFRGVLPDSGVATFVDAGFEGIPGTTYTITYSAIGVRPLTQTVYFSKDCNGISIPCQIGDIGPGGGEVFYYSQTPFACGPTLTNTCNYLELAPTAGPAGFEVGGNDWTETTKQAEAIGQSARGTAIGTGYKNSLAMAAQWGDIYHAATTSRAFRGPNNKDDWYLGSRDEVALIYSYFQDSISDYPFWTSTEFSATEALAILADGTAEPRNKNGFPTIWPIRAFSAGNQVPCGTSGYFVVSNNVITSHDNCAGSVVIPNGVTEIGNSAFYGTNQITRLTIPNTVETIGASAFSSVSSLIELNIGNGVRVIGDNAFSGSSSLRSLIIPEGVRFIGAFAFEEDFRLETLVIPSTVESIGSGAFDGTTALTSFKYCGTRLSRQDFVDAGLGNKEILPCISAPSAPTSLVAQSTGKRSAKVTITNTASNGGSAIASFTITASPGGLSKSLPVNGNVTSLVYEFTNLQPGTRYTFSVTATNTVGTSSATFSNVVTTLDLVVASISTLTYADDGTGSAGKLVWTGKNIDSVLFIGPVNTYPGPFNYGAFSSSWNGSIRNLIPETSYTVSLAVVSEDGLGESKSLTFTTSVKAEVVKDLTFWNTWLKANTFMPNEADNLIGLLNKFSGLATSPYRSYLKVPLSRVSTVTATSLTPKSCSVIATTAKVDAGLVKALTNETCTISYTVSGGSKAPATLVKEFLFKKIG